jgi:flagellar biosynthesis protein FlhB
LSILELPRIKGGIIVAESNKTEKATPKKRRDERKKGNAFQSKDVISVVVLLVGFILLSKLGSFIVAQIKELYLSQMIKIESLHKLTIQTCTSMLVEFAAFKENFNIPTILITHNPVESEMFADHRIYIEEGKILRIST